MKNAYDLSGPNKAAAYSVSHDISARQLRDAKKSKPRPAKKGKR